MYDQAERLRKMVQDRQGVSGHATRVITVTSGKGGVGKSNLSLNFALGLSAAGKKVVVLDADVGFANINVLLGKSPQYTLADLINQRATIWDILEHGPRGLHYIAGGSGLYDLVHLQREQLNYLFGQLEKLQGFADYLIIDTGAGLSEGTLQFILSADEIIVVCTPEPTAITDAYALIKLVALQNANPNIRLVVNRAATVLEGKQTAEKLSLVVQRFLDVKLQTLGFVLDDPQVQKAVKEQVPFFIRYPHSAASRCIEQLVRQQLQAAPAASPVAESGIKSFLSRMTSIFRERR